jgi:uncharacterized membrane protein YfcA
MELSLAAWIGAFAVTFLAGFVKGAVGFAMPLVMISGLSAFLDPVLAVAGIVIPIVLSNALQTFRAGLRPALSAVSDFRVYITLVCVAILLFAQLVPRMDPRVFLLVLGVPTIVLSAIQLAGLRLRVPEGRRRGFEWGAGLASGALGGLAGTWGPPTVLYLLAIDTPKARQMVVQGVIYGAGSVALLVAHLVSGVLNRETAPFSLALVVPALLGMAVGFRAGDRLDQALFRKATLIVLAVAGANLIRRALMG